MQVRLDFSSSNTVPEFNV